MIHGRRRTNHGGTLAVGVLVATSVVALIPIALAVRVALTPRRGFADQGLFGSGAALTLDNVARAWDAGLGAALVTTAAAALLVTALQVPTTFLLASVLVHSSRGSGARLVRGVLIAGYLLPPITLAIPVYLGATAFGLRGTFFGIVAPVLLVSPFAVFLFMRAIERIPREIRDAALIDGAGPVRMLRSISLPLTRATIVVVAGLAAASQWNAFLWPTLIAAGRVPIVTTLISSLNSQYDRDWTLVMAASCLSLVPPCLVALIALAVGASIRRKDLP